MKLIEDINSAVVVLRKGDIIAHPADTCYGLAADLNSESALNKLQSIKERDGSKPMSIMIPNSMKSKLDEYVALDDFSRKVCDRLLPGPVTIVLPKGSKIPGYFFPESNTVGIRFPDDSITDDLLEQFGEPIITTSANFSGQTPCYSDTEVMNVFYYKNVQPLAVLKSKPLRKKPPSTVLAVRNGKIELLRAGPISGAEIDKILAD